MINHHSPPITTKISRGELSQPMLAQRVSRFTPGRILFGHADGTISTRGETPSNQKSKEKKEEVARRSPSSNDKEAMRWLASFESLFHGEHQDRPPRENKILTCIASMPQSAAENEAVLARVRALLLEEAMQNGVTEVHKATSQRLLSLRSWRWHNDQRVPGHIETISLHPSGRYLAIGSNCGFDNNPGGTIQLYDMATGHCVQTIYNISWGLGQGRSGSDQDRMRWSPDGKLLGSSFDQRGVAVFDPFAKRNHMRAIPQYAGVDPSPAWCFVGDQEVAVGTWVNGHWSRVKHSFLPLSLYNIPGSPHAFRPLDQNKPIKGFDKENLVDWNQWMGASPDGKMLCIAARELAMVIDTKTKEIVCKMDRPGGYHSKGALFSPDANWFYNGALYSTQDGKKLPLSVADFDSRWSPNSEWLAIAGKDGVCLYSTKQKKIAATIPCDTPQKPYDVLLGDSGSLAFSPDSQFLAVKEASQVSVWRISQEPEEKARITLESGREVSGLALGINAETLALWGREHVEFWHVSSMKLLNLVRWTDALNQYYQDEAGHPLACAGGNAANVFPQDPSFPVPGLGWITALPTGLIICPPQLQGVLYDRLSLIIGDWFSWPLSWAIENFSVVDGVQEWVSSGNIPKKIALLMEKWRLQKGQSTNTGLQSSQNYGVKPSYTLGWYEPEDEYVIRDAKHAEEILLSLRGRLVRIEQETDWGPDKVKVGVAYEYKPEYVMIGLSMNDDDTGVGSGVGYKSMRKVYTLRFSGHPEDAIPRAEISLLLPLSQKRVALLNVTRTEITKILTDAGAIIVAENESPELFVVQDPLTRAEQNALINKMGDIKSVPRSALCELAKLDSAAEK